HARLDELVGYFLRRLRRGHEDGDVGRLLLQVARDVAYIAHHQPVPAGADLARVFVIYRRDMEAALPKPRILGQRPADAPGAHQHDSIGPFEPQDLPQPTRELGHGVAEPALAEGAEEREVLAHLGRRGGAAAGELGGGDGGVALRVELLEEPQIQGEPSHRALGDLPHIVNNFTIHAPSARAARTARAPASRVAPLGRARAARDPRAPPAPAGTPNSRSTRHDACTPTLSAPYARDPGRAASRSPTSRCTRNTIRSGSGGVRALSIRGEVMAKGMLPTTLNCGLRIADCGFVGLDSMRACQSNFSASPCTTSALPN